MTAKEYLESPRELDRKINQKLRLLESYKDLAGSISSPNFDEKVQGTRSTDPPFVRYLGKIDELQREIDADIDRLADLKCDLSFQIDRIDEIGQAVVLRYRYVQLLTWAEISEKMNYSVRWIQKIHGKALESFEERMNAGLETGHGSSL